MGQREHTDTQLGVPMIYVSETTPGKKNLNEVVAVFETDTEAKAFCDKKKGRKVFRPMHWQTLEIGQVLHSNDINDYYECSGIQSTFF